VAKFTTANQPSRRGRTGPVRSTLYKSTVSVTPVPRGYDDHRTRQARTYLAYVAAALQRFGSLPAMAMTTLRECGRLTVDLETVAHEAEKARGLPLRRARRRQIILRSQLGRLEDRLEQMAAGTKPTQTLSERVAQQIEAHQRQNPNGTDGDGD
jgi:hypothetical protein